jgi:hypothetical protein
MPIFLAQFSLDAMSRRCPNCKLTNPTDAVQCDCGYDFITGEFPLSAIRAEKATRGRLAERWSVFIMLIVGLPIAACLAIVIFVYVECYIFHNCI